MAKPSPTSRILAWLAPTSPEPELARRQRLLNLVLLGLAGPGLLFGLALAGMWLAGQIATPAGALAGLGVQPFYLLAYWLGRRGHVHQASLAPVVILFAIMTAASLQLGLGHVTLVGYALVVATAGVLIGGGAALLFALLSMIAYLGVGLAQTAGALPDTFTPEATLIADAIGLGLALVVLAIFDWLYSRELQQGLRREQDLGRQMRAQQTQLEDQVRQRTATLAQQAAQLSTAATVGRAITAILEPTALSQHIVALLRQNFGLDRAALYVLDDTGRYVVLAAEAHTDPARPIADPRIALDGISAVAIACTSQQPHLVQGPAAQLALPLLVGDRLLGALDLHAASAATLAPASTAILQLVADQVAVSLENAQLFGRAQANLEEMDRLYRLMSGEAWQQVMAAQPGLHHYAMGAADMTPPDWAPLFAQARSLGQPVSAYHALAVPVKLRGVPIGTLGLYRALPWQPEDLALAERVADRAALALENARLLEETRQHAAHDRLISELTDQVRASLDPDVILRTAVRELGRLLEAETVAIEMGVPTAKE